MSFISRTLAGAVLAAVVLGTAATGIASADAGAIKDAETVKALGMSQDSGVK